jgi:hypothetical protein
MLAASGAAADISTLERPRYLSSAPFWMCYREELIEGATVEVPF